MRLRIRDTIEELVKQELDAALGVVKSRASTKRFAAFTSRASTLGGLRARWRHCCRGGPLSKDAVSRLVERLRGDFETWRVRDLADEDIRYVFMDGWYPKVRILAAAASECPCW